MISIRQDQQPRHQSDARAESVDVPPGAPFVGRESELSQIRSGVDRMLAGQGQFVLLGGDPGIGKTRMAEEIVADARARDIQILWGRCFEWEGAPAFWPWIQMIRAYLRESEPDSIRQQSGSGAALSPRSVPELRELCGL
ncbi:MAG: ATP-binding protein [Thermomicrobiales bacterium]